MTAAAIKHTLPCKLLQCRTLYIMISMTVDTSGHPLFFYQLVRALLKIFGYDRMTVAAYLHYISYPWRDSTMCPMTINAGGDSQVFIFKQHLPMMAFPVKLILVCRYIIRLHHFFI